MSDPSDSELKRLRQKKLEEMKDKMTTPKTAGGVLHLTTQDFEQTVGEGVTLVDFFAVWCQPCHMMSPVIDKLSVDFAGQAKVAKIDVDQNPDIAMRYRVMGVPTFGVFKDGKLVHRVVGAVGYEPLKAALDQFL